MCGWGGGWEQYANICTCVCTLPPELLLALPLLAAPGACCQQLLHHINAVDAVHDQCLQLQLQHMQLLNDQLNGFQFSACVPCGKRYRDNMAKGWISGVAMETQKMEGKAVQWRVQVTKISSLFLLHPLIRISFKNIHTCIRILTYLQ